MRRPKSLVWCALILVVFAVAMPLVAGGLTMLLIYGIWACKHERRGPICYDVDAMRSAFPADADEVRDAA